jgi:hypothetical protein
MALSEKQLDNPQFIAVSHAVTVALLQVAERFDCDEQVAAMDSHAGRVVDEMTALILRAIKAKGRT